MGFRKGGYGTYKMKPSWDVYGSKHMYLESNRPMPEIPWRSPRRTRTDYNTSGTHFIELVKKHDGSYGMPRPFKPKWKPRPGLAPIFPIVGELLDRALNEAEAWMLRESLAESQGGGEFQNDMWERHCREPHHTNVNCYGDMPPSMITFGNPFCVYNNEWPPGSQPVGQPGVMGIGAPQGWVYVAQNCLYPPWWNSWKQWQRKREWDYWGQDWPIQKRFWDNPQKTKLDPNVFPEALPVGGLMPNPARRPHWATPQRHPAAVVGREHGYTSPGAVLPPAPPENVFPPHVKEPPGPGTVEQKKRMPRWLIKAAKAVFFMTEVADALEAIAEAFGYDKKTDGPMAQFIYRKWATATDAELQQAILNVILNEIEDQFVGRLSGSVTIDGIGTFDRIGDSWVMRR